MKSPWPENHRPSPTPTDVGDNVTRIRCSCGWATDYRSVNTAWELFYLHCGLAEREAL